MTRYIYDPAWEHERARLDALEALLDPGSIRHLETIGVAPGWRCLEVGGGGGSITRWLCDRVGPSGSVVATDLDTRFLDAIDAANLELRVHDAVKEDFESAAFDLVHSRDVLEHIPEHLDVLRKMIAALKPGGWILIEDVDFATELYGTGFAAPADIAPLLGKLWRGNADMMRSRGIDPEFGRRLPELFFEHGLEDVRAEIRAAMRDPSSPQGQMVKLALAHLGPMLIEHGAVTQEELDHLAQRLDDPKVVSFAPLHVSAWGRKPS
jgi:SAM-dependent methyltransferase